MPPTVLSMNIFLTGLLTGFALIIAVGAQNAFVLRQSLRGERVVPVIIVCVLSDILAITVGVAGLGVVMERWPAVLPIAQIGGGLYLLAFGVQSAMRAWKPTAMDTEGGTPMTVRRAVLLTVALTWLNPHFYLDAIVMLGTVANSFGDQRWAFAAGSIVASLIWFPILGFGARFLRGIFARPSAWRVLDSGIAVLMGTLGVGLLVH